MAIWKPVEREVMPPDCAMCASGAVCRELPTATGVALLWRTAGTDRRRRRADAAGEVASFFSQGRRIGRCGGVGG